MNAFVYIVESPQNSDLRVGRAEGKALCQALTLAEIPHRYSLVTDLKTLRQALGPKLVEAWTTLNKFPILHLSMHGNQEGISLTNESDFLSWNSLRQELLPLNRVMSQVPNGGLLICMSSCFGSSGCRMAMYTDNEPSFRALVGNVGKTGWADAAVAYITFYHLFFKGLPLDVCVDSMRVASGDYNFDFRLGKNAKAIYVDLLQKEMDRLIGEIRCSTQAAQQQVEHAE